MSIEFACPQCGRTLRTPDGSEGKRAKCPSCQGVTTIPQSSAAAGSVFDDLSPIASAADPFAGPAMADPANPFAESVERAPSGGDSFNPYASPYAPTRMESAPSGTLRHSTIDFNDVLSESWNVFSNNMGSLVLLALMMAGAVIGAYIIMGVLIGIVVGIGVAMGAEAAMGVALIVGGIAALIAWIYLFAWLGAGITQYTLSLARGQPTTFNDVFSGQRYTGRMAGFVFLVHLLLTGGLVALGTLPGFMEGNELLINFGQLGGQAAAGLITTLLFFLAPYFIVDRNQGLFASIGSSVTYLSGNRLILFALLLVVAIVGMLFSMVTCGLGLLLYFPYFWMFQAVVYLKATGQGTGRLR